MNHEKHMSFIIMFMVRHEVVTCPSLRRLRLDPFEVLCPAKKHEKKNLVASLLLVARHLFLLASCYY